MYFVSCNYQWWIRYDRNKYLLRVFTRLNYYELSWIHETSMMCSDYQIMVYFQWKGIYLYPLYVYKYEEVYFVSYNYQL